MSQQSGEVMPLTDQQAAAAQHLPENLHIRGAIRLTVSDSGGPPSVGGFPLPPEPRP